MEIKELRQRWLFLKKKRDQNKEPKKLRKDTLERRRFWKNDVHKKYVNNKKENKREKRQENKETQKKETRDEQKGVTSFDKGVQNNKL